MDVAEHSTSHLELKVPNKCYYYSPRTHVSQEMEIWAQSMVLAKSVGLTPSW